MQKKWWTSFQAASSYRRTPRRHCFETWQYLHRLAAPLWRTSLVLSKLLRSEGQGNNEPCLEWTGKSSMDWNLLLLINKKPQLASAKMKTETLPWQPATTAAVSNIHWQLSCNISWTLNSALTWAQHLHWESEWVGFNVPINTLQVISETSLSSQSLALVLTT